MTSQFDHDQQILHSPTSSNGHSRHSMSKATQCTRSWRGDLHCSACQHWEIKHKSRNHSRAIFTLQCTIVVWSATYTPQARRICYSCVRLLSMYFAAVLTSLSPRPLKQMTTLVPFSNCGQSTCRQGIQLDQISKGRRHNLLLRRTV